MTVSAYVIPGLKYKIEGYLTPQEKAERVIECVLDYLQMPFSSMVQHKRKREIVYSRQLCMYFLKAKTRCSLAQIGAMLAPQNAQYDHTTVIHGIKHIEDLLFSDSKVKVDVENIKRLL